MYNHDHVRSNIMFIYQFLQVPSVLVSLSLVTSFLIKKSFIGKERVNNRVFYPDLFTMHAVYDAVRVRGIKYKTWLLYSGFLLPHVHVYLFSLHRSKKYFVVSFFARVVYSVGLSALFGVTPSVFFGVGLRPLWRAP